MPNLLLFSQLFSLILVLVPITFSLTITEINFQNSEFIELILTNSSVEFNESYFYIFDESEDKNNTFSLLHSNVNSSIILIVGSNFITEYLNYDELNCSIYQTSGSQVGYGGMNSNSENFSIQFNKNLFVNYSTFSNINFEENESLNLIGENLFEINNYSICDLNPYQKFLINNLSEINTNDSKNNSELNNQCELEILVDKIIEDNKLSFSFEGNISYGVTYSILDGVGNEVKSPYTSTSLSSKSYTPKKNGKFIILAEINDDNCEIETNKEVFFYNLELDEDNEDSTSISINEDTFIEIHSVLLKGIHQVIISGEISRGDSSKYKLKILVDDEEVSEFSVKKYGQFDFEIPLFLKPGKHEIVIEGFGKREEINIEMPDVVLEIEDNLIVLIEEKGIEFDNEIQSIVQVPLFDKKEFEETVELIVKNVSENEFNILDSKENFSLELEKEPMTLKSLFSKNIINQNIGISLMILAIVIISLLIIFKR